ncbi:hypothetical protein [Intrasporangium sp. YIM S08009]|uniref:hypothetical protein n=1 Tax=Intrasporangium zincisolvens TaxID=3080018 RepID=UPI002B053F7A|nr:hypothetical protein [Intrasporangium sp. YIM S08009]
MLFMWLCLFCATALVVVLLAAPWRRGDPRAQGPEAPGRQDGQPVGPAPGRGRLLAGRIVVALAWAQCVAALVLAGFGGYYALESARPDNGSTFAQLGVAIGVVVAAVGLVGAAAFAAVGKGLRRRYRQVRHVFAGVQALLLVVVLWSHASWSGGAAVYLAATLVLCYLGDVENATAAPSHDVAAATPGRDDERGETA